MNNEGFAPIILIIIAALFVAGIGGYFVFNHKNPSTPAVIPSDSASTVLTNTTTENNAAQTGQKVYENNDYGFSFAYPADFKLSTDLTAAEHSEVSSYIPICNENTATCLYYIGGGYENTNFGAAGLSIERSVTPTRSECLKTITSNEAATDRTAINGVIFYHDIGGGAAAGHSASDDTYRTYYNGACYSLVAVTTETSYKNLKEVNPALRPFDRSALAARLKVIVSSFRFTVPDAMPAKENVPAPITLATFNDGRFAFSYPSDRQVIWSRADGFGIGKMERAGLNTNTTYDISLTIDNRSMDEIKSVLAKNTGEPPISIALAGEQGLLYSKNGKPNIIFVPHGGKIYQINVSSAPADMYATFIKTFRFLI